MSIEGTRKWDRLTKDTPAGSLLIWTFNGREHGVKETLIGFTSEGLAVMHGGPFLPRREYIVPESFANYRVLRVGPWWKFWSRG